MSYKKQLIVKQQREVQEGFSLTEVIITLKRIFKHAIGRDEGLEMEEIYREVYGEVERNPYLRFFKLQVIHHAINVLKKNTDYFIISDINSGGKRVWFIVHSYDEARTYCDEVDKKIGGLRFMKNKCIEFVDKKRYLRLR